MNYTHLILQAIGSGEKGLTDIYPIADLSPRDLHFYLRCMVVDGYLSDCGFPFGPYRITLKGHDALSQLVQQEVDTEIDNPGKVLGKQTQHKHENLESAVSLFLYFLGGAFFCFFVKRFLNL